MYECMYLFGFGVIMQQRNKRVRGTCDVGPSYWALELVNKPLKMHRRQVGVGTAGWSL